MHVYCRKCQIILKQEMCNKAVKYGPWHLIHVPDHFKAQGMCEKAVDKYPLVLVELPDHFKTQEMCNKAAEKNSCLLVFATDL